MESVVAEAGPGALEVVGPTAVRLPGSDQFMFLVGVVLLAGGLVGLAVAWWVRRRRRRTEPERRRRPVGISVAVVVAVIGAGLAVANRPLPWFPPEFPPLPRLLPEQAFFYRQVDDVAVSTDSDRWIAEMVDDAGRPLPLVPGFGDVPGVNLVYGIPFNLVDADTPRRDVAIDGRPQTSPPGPYPITDPAYIETAPLYGIDNHYVGLDLGTRQMWELIAVRRWFGRWGAFSGAQWDLDSLTFPAGSTTASGLPLLPGTVTYDEVAAGRVGHVILATGPFPGSGHIWPARDSDGPNRDPDAPPQGAWMRLRADVPVDDLPPQARVVAEAMQTYGIVLSDTAGTFSLRGTPDRRWDQAQLSALSRLTTADFEVVDSGPLMVSPDSMAAAPP